MARGVAGDLPRRRRAAGRAHARPQRRSRAPDLDRDRHDPRQRAAGPDRDCRQPPRCVDLRRRRSVEWDGRAAGDGRARLASCGGPAGGRRAPSCSPAGTPRSSRSSPRRSGARSTRPCCRRRRSPISTSTAASPAASSAPRRSRRSTRPSPRVAQLVKDPAAHIPVAAAFRDTVTSGALPADALAIWWAIALGADPTTPCS